MEQLTRRTFVEESAHEKYYKGNPDYDDVFDKVEHTVSQVKKMGYWVRGIFNQHYEGHHIFQSFET